MLQNTDSPKGLSVFWNVFMELHILNFRHKLDFQSFWGFLWSTFSFATKQKSLKSLKTVELRCAESHFLAATQSG